METSLRMGLTVSEICELSIIIYFATPLTTCLHAHTTYSYSIKSKLTRSSSVQWCNVSQYLELPTCMYSIADNYLY